MRFPWTNLAVCLVAITPLGCGGIRALPVAPSSAESETFVQGGDSIDITGQKGIGKREGDTYTKTFIVENKASTSEDVSVTQNLQSTVITIIASVVNKEDNFVQGDTVLSYEFRLTQAPYQGVIDAVYINGVQVNNDLFAYNAQNGALYFPGRYVVYSSKIRAVYRADGGAHPSYVFNANANAVGASIADATTGAAIQGTFSNNVVYFSNVGVGQKMLVKFYLKDQAIMFGALKSEPVAGSIKINLPQCANAVLTTTGKQFSSHCLVLDRVSIPVSYDYIDTSKQLFSVPEVGSADIGQWEVLIDGVVSNEYRRIGSKFYIDHIIPFGSKVEIKHRRN